MGEVLRVYFTYFGKQALNCVNFAVMQLFSLCPHFFLIAYIQHVGKSSVGGFFRALDLFYNELATHVQSFIAQNIRGNQSYWT